MNLTTILTLNPRGRIFNEHTPFSSLCYYMYIWVIVLFAVSKLWLSCTKDDGSPERKAFIQSMTWISAAYPTWELTSALIATSCTCGQFYYITSKSQTICPSLDFNGNLHAILKNGIVLNIELTLFWQIGYCTFMYGVTGNYLLHVLWIILITFALLLTGVYLRKYWLDIKGRYVYAYYVLHSLLWL